MVPYTKAIAWLAAVFACTSANTLAAQGAAAANDQVQLSGYVTTSYNYATKPTDRAIVGRLFDRTHDEFTINAARLTLQKAVTPEKRSAGFQVDALVGKNAGLIQSAGLSLGNDADLTQAFVTLNLPTRHGNFVQFKAGKMWTLMGVELVDDVLNANVSVGNQFVYLAEFTETGVGVEAKLSSAIDAQLRVTNGWDVVTDNNTAKTVAARLAITASKRVDLALSGYVGPERADNTHDNRYGGEFVGSLKASKTAVFTAQFDAGGEQGLGTNGASARWVGAGAWGVFDLDSGASLALRADYLDDKNGVRTSGVLGFPDAPSRKLTSGTITLNIKSWEHALVRPELRFEHSSRSDFGAAGTPSATQLTLGVALSYIF